MSGRNDPQKRDCPESAKAQRTVLFSAGEIVTLRKEGEGRGGISPKKEKGHRLIIRERERSEPLKTGGKRESNRSRKPKRSANGRKKGKKKITLIPIRLGKGGRNILTEKRKKKSSPI